MNLLFIHERLGAFGGAESNILLTAGQLRARGHRVMLLYGQRTGQGEAAWNVFERSEALPANASGQWLERWVAESGAEVIYLHKFSNLEMLDALRKTRVPVVRMVHDHELYCLRGYKYNYFTRKPCTRPTSGYCVFPCLAVVARNRDGGLPVKFQSLSGKKRELELNRSFEQFIVYSDYSRQELIRNGFEAGRIHIHAPIPELEPDAPTSNFGPRNLIIFAGQIIRGKGVDALIRALAQVQSKFECLIFGEGSHRSHCERLARKLGLGDRVHFTGFRSGEEMRSHYLQACMAVMSSLWPEPFGMAGPEAMRYGLPVVAFDAGGISEWLRDGENGFLAPWRDEAKFAELIDTLLGDKGRARALGLRGREMVRSNYSPERQIQTLEGIFEQTALRNPLPGRNTNGMSRGNLGSAFRKAETISN